MIDYYVAIWLSVVALFEVPAIAAAMLMALDDRIYKNDNILLFGFALMTLGMMAQIYRTIHYFKYGAYPIDVFFPLWVLKDIGFSIFTLRFAQLLIRG